MFFRVTIILLLLATSASLLAQRGTPPPEASRVATDSSVITLTKLPARYLETVYSKADKLEKKLDKASEKALVQFQKQEAKMKKKLQKIDSLAANSIFADAPNQYKELTNRIKNSKQLSHYIPGLDTLSTSLKFLQQNPQLLSQAKEVKEKLKDVTSKVKELEGQFQKAGEIKKFLRERR
jgi:thiamine kinase-like enzyme